MKTFLQDSRDVDPRDHRSRGKLSGLTILGRNFVVVWRGRGWELVAVVALLIVALLVWFHFK